MVKEEHATPPPPPLTSFPACLQVRGDPCPPCIPETLAHFHPEQEGRNQLSLLRLRLHCLCAQKEFTSQSNMSHPLSSVYYFRFQPFLFPAPLTHIFILTHSLLTHLVCIRPSVLHFSGPFWAPLSCYLNCHLLIQCTSFIAEAIDTQESTGVKPWHSAHWSSYKTLNWSVAKTSRGDG